MHIKDFEGWGKLKKNLSNKYNENLVFNEKEIWWCSIGVNVGDEEDGKNQLYNRPVLIIKKFNQRLFWGVPTTSKIKDSDHYFKIKYNGVENCVMLSHLRLYDSKRLDNKKAKISDAQFTKVVNELRKILSNLLPPY